MALFLMEKVAYTEPFSSEDSTGYFGGGPMDMGTARKNLLSIPRAAGQSQTRADPEIGA